MRPAPDFFADRRRRAGIPDAPLGAPLAFCGRMVPPAQADAAREAMALGVPVVCGRGDCVPCSRVAG